MKKIKALFASAQPMLLWGLLPCFYYDPIMILNAKGYLILIED